MIAPSWAEGGEALLPRSERASASTAAEATGSEATYLVGAEEGDLPTELRLVGPPGVTWPAAGGPVVGGENDEEDLDEDGAAALEAAAVSDGVGGEPAGVTGERTSCLAAACFRGRVEEEEEEEDEAAAGVAGAGMPGTEAAFPAALAGWRGVPRPAGVAGLRSIAEVPSYQYVSITSVSHPPSST